MATRAIWATAALISALLATCGCGPTTSKAGERDTTGETGGANDGSGGASAGGADSTGGGGGADSADCESIPSYGDLPLNDLLPDPFTMTDSSPVGTKDEWACRRAEISALVQEYELGPKPPKPESVTASFSSGTLHIDCEEAGQSISFSVDIAGGSDGEARPAVIVFGMSSLPFPSEVATIAFDNDLIAEQLGPDSRGVGLFYDLYGSIHEAGALMAWAWGVSRIIDALQVTPEAGIDPTRVGVTGCSRYGKGALIAGAFDERIALTIPQESGSGGSACWRVSEYQKSQGEEVQTLSHITGENVWFRHSFKRFNQLVPKVPFDHHMIMGLVAPRGLLVIENTDQIWLGNLSCYTCAVAGQRIYEALGAADHMGVSQVGHPNHCELVSEQQPEFEAYVDKFLLDESADTTISETDGGFTFDEARWVDWDTPALE